MSSEEKYEYWLDAAKYDLETARVMINGGRYMYVAFMCQQAIEKISKGIYTLYTDNDAPMVHNIWNIIRQLRRDANLEEYLDIALFEDNLIKHKNLFVELLSFYISGRYPSFKEKISSSIDVNRAKNILISTEEAFKWIESLSQFKI